jgi:iron-sulfur cluster repair protein YtfE (RIC family)
MEIRSDMTLNQIIDAAPGALKVLGDLGFDTCCGGWEEVGAAAARKGIAWEKVTAALATLGKGA